MYRLPKNAENMSRSDRFDYFSKIAKDFPESKKRFTGEELMISKDFGAYELFRTYARLGEVGYFYVASDIFWDRFTNKWARIETADYGSQIVYVRSVCSPYTDDFAEVFEDGEGGTYFTELDDELDWWGALLVEDPTGYDYAIPFCYILEAEYFTDEDSEELQNLIEKEKRELQEYRAIRYGAAV